MYKSIFKYVFAILLIGLSFIYLYQVISKDPESIRNVIAKLPFGILCLAVLLSMLAGICNVYVWHKINKDYSTNTKFLTSYYAWTVSRIFRYIPGKAFGYIVRHKLQNSSLKTGIKSSINEFILTIITVLTLAIFYFSLHLADPYILKFFIISILSYALLVFIKPLSVVLELALNTLKIPVKFNQIFSKPLIYVNQSFYGLPALLFHGASFFLLINYGFQIEQVDYLYLTVTLFFSGIIGQLSLISPAGLGVREASLTFFMVNQGFSTEIALAAALCSRIIFFLSEVLNVLIAISTRNIYRND